MTRGSGRRSVGGGPKGRSERKSLPAAGRQGRQVRTTNEREREKKKRIGERGKGRGIKDWQTGGTKHKKEEGWRTKPTISISKRHFHIYDWLMFSRFYGLTSPTLNSAARPSEGSSISRPIPVHAPLSWRGRRTADGGLALGAVSGLGGAVMPPMNERISVWSCHLDREWVGMGSRRTHERGHDGGGVGMPDGCV